MTPSAWKKIPCTPSNQPPLWWEVSGCGGIKMTDKEKVEEIRRQIEDLKKRLPAHSIPPAMIAELDELEEKLEEELKKRGNKG
jgi:hypothetical protein